MPVPDRREATAFAAIDGSVLLGFATRPLEERDAADGRTIRRFDEIACAPATIVPVGREHIATIGRDEILRVFDLRSASLRWELPSCTSLSAHPDREHMVVCQGHRLFLVGARTGQLVREVETRSPDAELRLANGRFKEGYWDSGPSRVGAIVVTPKGRVVTIDGSPGGAGEIRVWDLGSGMPVRTLVSAETETPTRGGQLVSRRGRVRTCEWTFDGWSPDASPDSIHYQHVTWIGAVPEAERVVALTSDLRVAKRWNLDTGACTTIVLEGSESSHVAAALSADGRHLAVADDRGALRVWALDDGALAGQWKNAERIVGVAFPNDRRLLMLDALGHLHVAHVTWDAAPAPRTSESRGGEGHLARRKTSAEGERPALDERMDRGGLCDLRGRPHHRRKTGRSPLPERSFVGRHARSKRARAAGSHLCHRSGTRHQGDRVRARALCRRVSVRRGRRPSVEVAPGGAGERRLRAFKHDEVFDVAVSYSSEDLETRARPLIEALRARGLWVYLIDVNESRGDTLWRIRYREALVHSRFFLPVATTHYPAREGTRVEMFEMARLTVEHRATEHFYPLLPWLGPDVDPAEVLRTWQSNGALRADDREGYAWVLRHVPSLPFSAREN